MAQVAERDRGALQREEEIPVQVERRARNPLSQAWGFLRRYPVIPGLVIAGLIIMGAFAPLLAPRDPYVQNLRDFRGHAPTWGRADEHNRPGPPNPADFDTANEDGAVAKKARADLRMANRFFHARAEFILGGDALGRDVLSRVIQGARVSMKIVLYALFGGIIAGVTMGVVAGYFGGWTDEIIMRLVDMWLGLPFLLIAIVIAVVLGASETTVMILLLMLAWTGYVRQVRGEVLVLRTRDYVAAAKITGASTVRILWKHILPGTMGLVMIIASLSVGGLILAEASLAFLGVGIPDPIPAWGKSVSEGREYLSTQWWISFWPGFAIFLVVMSLNFSGDWLRDRLDPRLRQVD